MARKRPVSKYSRTARIRLTEKEWETWVNAADRDDFDNVSQWIRRLAKKRAEVLDVATE
jgi:hypothetical protein